MFQLGWSWIILTFNSRLVRFCLFFVCKGVCFVATLGKTVGETLYPFMLNQKSHDMERIKDCKVCMACRPGVGQHSHVTRSQHVGLHVGPATVISNTMFAGLQTACRLDVGWMSAGCRPVSAMRFPLQPFLALCKPKTPP